MTGILIISHLVAVIVGGLLYKSYAANAIAEAKEAKEWAESTLADFKAAAAKDAAALKAKIPGVFK